MKRRLSFILYTLLFSVALVSCNLFIDDEYDGTIEDFEGAVPVHTGEGYDAPVTYTDDNCTVVYQYKSNVHVLSQEEQDRYIVLTKKDAAGGLIEVHYRADTPKDVLPVPGEILMSGPTERFPWGCNHQVMSRFREGDVYIMVAGFMTLEDAFEELDINGALTTTQRTEYYFDEIPEENEGNDVAATRSPEIKDNINVSIDSPEDADYFTLNMSFSYSGKLQAPLGMSLNISMRTETNYSKTTYRFDFDDFSLRNRNFKFRIIETYEEHREIDFSGKWEGSLFHKRFDPLSPKPGLVLVAGPAVFVVFVYVDLDFGMAVEASSVLTKYYKTITTYTVDLRNLTITKTISEKANEPWALQEKTLNLYLSLSASIHIGLGLYGKVISARIIIQPCLSLKMTFPMTINYADGESIIDLKNKPGIHFSVDMNFSIGAFIDLSLRKLLGGNNVSKDVANQRLDDYQAGLKRESSYYRDMLQNEKKSFDPNSEYYKKKSLKEKVEESDIGLSATYTWTILSSWQPWYPEIEDNSFAVNSVWDKEKKKYKFTAEYKVLKTGFFAGTGLQMIPCLRIKDSKDENAKRHYIWPVEGGKSAKLQEEKTYHFNIEDRNDNIVYEIAPCYFQRPFTDTSMPLAVDKEEKRGLATPRMTVQNVEVMQYKCTKDPVGFDDQYYDENEKKYEYEYKWMLSTITSIKGIPYMSDWFIDEELNWNKYNVLRNEMKNEDSYVTLNNDRYEMYWTILKYSHKYEENRKLDVKFVPVYILKEDRYQQYQHCEEWECHLEGGVLKSRAATGTAEGDKVICRLDAIKKDGEVVWQRDGQGLAPVQERTKFVNI